MVYCKMNEIHLCVIILNLDQWIICVVFLALVAILFWNRVGNFGRGPCEELLCEKISNCKKISSGKKT